MAKHTRKGSQKKRTLRRRIKGGVSDTGGHQWYIDNAKLVAKREKSRAKRRSREGYRRSPRRSRRIREQRNAASLLDTSRLDTSRLDAVAEEEVGSPYVSTDKKDDLR